VMSKTHLFFMPEKRFLNFINGEFTESKSGQFFPNINPANKEEVLGYFPKSDARDVSLAVKAAKEALSSWKNTPSPKRGEFLYKIVRLIENRKEEIADVIVKEMGKTKKGALGDVQSGINMALYMAGEGRRLYGKTTFSESDRKWALTRKEPVGICGLITPWNYPMANISWKTFPALICGNTVILKPAEDTPQTAQIFAEIIKESGLPKGVFNLVQGLGEEAGEALVLNPDVNLISFTGSTEIGKRINKLCADKLIKVSLEMGGKNGVLVLKDADIDKAVESVALAAFTMAGQRCSATTRVIIEKDIYDIFLEKLIKRAKELKIGSGDKEDTDICPVINQKQLDRISNYVELGKREGAKLILGGEALNEGIYSKGFYLPSTIFTDVSSGMKIWREEIFGPVLCVVKCDSFKEGIELLNDADYALTSSIYTKNIDLALEGLEKVESGVCYINSPTFGSEVHLPFGGFKKSGSGYFEAGGAIEVFTRQKTIYINYQK